MVSGIRFLACSGVMGHTETDSDDVNLEILEIFDITQSPGDTESPLRLGFFGVAGAPNGAVIVEQYQDRSHRVNHDGDDLGVYINVKFTGSSDASVSGVSFPNIEDIPARSGTIMCRFQEPNGVAVITQNAFMRAISFDSTSGALTGTADRPSNIFMYAMQLADRHGNSGDSTWTLIADDAGSPTDLSVNNQTGEANVHDFYFGLSASPKVTGRLRSFGWMLQLEFL